MKWLFMQLPENWRAKSSVAILGVNVHPIPLARLLADARTNLKSSRRMIIGNVNIHALNLAFERLSFREALNSFDIVFCDGFGAKLGAWLTGQYIPERYTPPDFIHILMQIVREQDGSVFLLGAASGVAERAAQSLVLQTPGLRIAGIHHGYFDKTPGSTENQAVIGQINTVQPSLLLIALGMPYQEEWLAENKSHLKFNVAMTVGALFDTLAGDIPRAPRWVTDYGLEWLARLLIEPRRLWARYLLGNPLFFWRIIYYHWLKGFLPRSYHI
jgi:N-acetylglucosaminyldiphosphoundecaprenol N-acetyl-beta-D-mannosaminyltransferase